ncbi:hypothetical protein CVU82_03425 [Candidatus Falkowbacteria bacterium HGW-Falkowbacteria-1]|jgi:protein-disulfide isomerase|uniref:Thioredoxin domain-containing protein n=1 Tax=Candidatus Falkowbacteria bacterium HGW-Falkowbacteria-1 TaxID=2013768 RepID=A0A2N2E8P1_9BACT|nr:MAG: hypothetical protein CVU82_03425 [Candidatus Falkowbacteria bacterium HGW-Falkowbacteria-1]
MNKSIKSKKTSSPRQRKSRNEQENKEIKIKKSSPRLKKDYFGVVFVLVSSLMFLVLIFSIAYFKNSLFSAKDMVELSLLRSEAVEKISPTNDPFVDSKGVKEVSQSNPVDNNNDPFLGEKSSKKLKLFYFSDFDCSFCFEQEKIIKNIYEKYKDEIVVVWKDYPDLTNFDDFSYQAARAARCAQHQGSFWDYSDSLYKERDSFKSLKNELFLNLAEKANLNLKSFSDCMEGSSVDNLIFENVKEAENLGISGVPLLYVNNKDFIGSMSESELDQIVENELDSIK